MAAHLNIELIFPIADERSAWLMRRKADCLYEAGVISASERRAVIAKAAQFAWEARDSV